VTLREMARASRQLGHPQAAAAVVDLGVALLPAMRRDEKTRRAG
jgi:hypothetical protein